MHDPQLVHVRLPTAGLRALKYLPKLEPRGELMLYTADLTIVDAWIATVLRTLIEYRARDQQVRVVLVPPQQAETRLFLAEMLGEPPSQLVWLGPNGEDIRAERDPRLLKALIRRSLVRRALLPAHRITNPGVADSLAFELPTLGHSVDRPTEVHFIIGAFVEFVENALTHGAESPVGVIGSIVFDPRSKALEAVVTDLGRGVPGDEASRFASLLSQPVSETQAGISERVEFARSRRLDATITLATNGNIFRWRQTGWRHRRTGALPGFTAAACVRW